VHVFKQKLFSGGLAVCFTLTSLFSPAMVAAAPNIQTASSTTTTQSIFGNDQYETAAKIAQEGWAETSDYAIVAAGMPANLIDALAAGPLASKLNAPILLTEGNSLNKNAKDQLARLNVKKVFVTSGSAVIKQSVIDEIKSVATVTDVKSLGGYDASETSVNIAKEMANQGTNITKVVVTSGAGSDALSMAPIAGAQGMPILYTSGSALSSYVSIYLDGLKANLAKTYVIGGTAVISDAVKAQIPGTVERYYGQTQYDTNIQVLKSFAGVSKNKTTYIANGETLVDALAGAPLAVKNNSLILLTSQTLPEASKNYALANLSSNVIGLGGQAVVPASVLESLAPQIILSQDGSSIGSEDSANLEQLSGLLKVTGNNVTVKNAKTNYSIYVQGDNVNLNNVTVNGTIFLDPGDNGTANLEKVTANNIVVLSGGQHSINLESVIAQLLNIQSSSPNVHINATGGTVINRTESSASVSFQAADGSFGTIRITYSAQTPGAPPVVELIGTFTDTIEVGGGVTVNAAPDAKVANLAIVTDNPEQTVTLKGNFESVTVNTKANVVLGDNTSVKSMVTKDTAKITVPKTSTIEKLDTGNTGSSTTGGGTVGGSTPPAAGGGGGSGGGGSDVVLKSIEITTPATKLIYTVGEALDVSGLVVKLIYSDGTYKTETVKAENVTGFDSSAPATQTLTITIGGKTTTFTVEIKAVPVLESLTITQPAAKLDYFVGETLDLTGLVVTGTYSDGTPKIETVTLTDVTGFDNTVPVESQILTITVGGKTITFEVRIKPIVLEYITIQTLPTKQIYTVGEDLDLAGLVVIGTYNYGSPKTETVSTANVSGFDSTTPAAIQILTVTVGGKTATFPVTIKLAKPSAPSFITATPVSGTSINVHWSLSNGATGYKVYRDGNLIKSDVTGTGYTDSGLDYDRTYYYYVVAYNQMGDSLPSGTTSAKTFKLGELIVSGVTNGATVNHAVTITAQAEGETVMMAEGSNLPTTMSAITISTEGDHTLTITAGTQSVTLNFTIDTIAPTVLITGVNDSAATIDFSTIPTITNSGVTLSVTPSGIFLANTLSVLLDGSPFDINQAVLQPGQHTVTASVKDAAGNVGTASVKFTIVWDTTAPIITIGGVAEGSTYGSLTPTVSVTGGSNESNYTYTTTITKPDGLRDVYLKGVSIPQLTAEGKYTISVDALNPSYVDITSQKVVQFWIDNNSPTVSINGVVEGRKYNTSVTPVINFTDTVASQALLKANSQAVLTKDTGTGPVTVPYSIGGTISDEGTYTLVVSTTDGALQMGTSPLRSFSIDKTSPVITVNGVTGGATYRENVTMTAGTTEGMLIVKVNGQSVDLTSGQYVFSGADNAVKDFIVEVKATDTAGNLTTNQFSFSIDKLAVSNIITGVTEGQYLNNLPTINFSAYVDGAPLPAETTTATLDGNNFTSGSSPTTEGAHTLVVTTQYGGQPYSKTIHFTVDLTPPGIVVNSVTKNSQVVTSSAIYVKAGDIVTVTATIPDTDMQSQSFSIDSPSGSVSGDILLDEGTTGSFTGTWTVGGGNSDNLVLNVSGKDKAGNINKAPWAQLINIDNSTPEVTLITNPATSDGQNGYYKAADMTVQLQAAVGEAITYTFNQDPQTTDTDGTVLLSAKQGHNTLTYQVEDQAGNLGDSMTFNFDYDSVLPLAPTQISPASGDTVQSAIANISGTVAAAPGDANPFGSTVVVRKDGVDLAEGSVASGGAFSVKGVPLNEGTNSLTLVTVDYAGNESNPIPYTLILDSTPPVLAVTKVDDTHYNVSVNEPISNLTATFNGTQILIDDIKSLAALMYEITTPAPQVGANALFLSASDSAGNLGTGSLTSSYIPPTVEQNNLEVSGNAMMDIPVGAFSNTTQMTVRTGTFTGDSTYKLLGGSLSFNFSEKPVNPVILKIFVGTGLKGVTLFHITEDGTVEAPITINTTSGSAISATDMVEDQGYYFPETGYVWLKTKNFSDYQAALDSTPPVIKFTVTDPVIKINKAAMLAGAMKLEGTVEDLDPDAKITKIEIDRVAQPALVTNITGKSFDIPLNLTDGQHKVKVTAEDSAENSTTVNKTFRIDVTPPDFSNVVLEGYVAVDGDVYVTNKDRVVLNFKLSKNAEVSVNGQTVGTKNGDNSLVLVLAGEGNNTFVIDAIDSFDNKVSETFTIRKDTISPNLNVEGVSNGGIYANDMDILVTSEDTLTPVVKIDGAVQSITNGSFTYSAANSGLHTLTATVTDLAGNTTTKTVTFTVDSSTPALSFSGVSNGQTYNTDQTLTITATNALQVILTKMMDNGASPQTVLLDATGGSASAICLDNEQFTYTFIATAMRITSDGAIKMANQAISFKIDKKAPVLEGAVGGVTPTEMDSIQVTGSLQDTADIEVYVNDIPTPFVTLTGLSAGNFVISNIPLSNLGDNIITLKAIDKSGKTTSKTLNARRVVNVKGMTAVNGQLTLTFSGNGSASLTEDDFNLTATLNGSAYTLVNLDYANGVFTFTPLAKTASNQTLELSLIPSGTSTKLGQVKGSPQTVTILGNAVPPAPNVSADDVNNIIVGIDNTMEYRLSTESDSQYKRYTSVNPPNLIGNVTILVRLAATSSYPASTPKTLVFTLNPVVLTSLAITTQATKLSYNMGETLDLSGLVVTGTYSDNTTKVISNDDINVTGFNSATPVTSQTLTITYGGRTTSYVIEIKAYLTSLAITTPATKLEYFVGEALDLTDLVVTGTYSDGTQKLETITKDNVTGFDSSVLATSQVLTIAVGNITVTYTVEIKPAPVVLTDLAINTTSAKLVYTVGEALDLSGVIVTGTYSNGTQKEETITTGNVTGFDSSVAVTSQVLTITVGNKSVTYTVEIKPASTTVLTGIAITNPATKLSYFVGDTLDISGLQVTGTYSDNTTKVESITEANVSGFNSTTSAAITLTITVGGHTATYLVEIKAAFDLFVDKAVEVYSTLSDSEKAALLSAKKALRDFDLDDDRWETIIGPLLTSEVVARFAEDSGYSTSTTSSATTSAAMTALITFMKDFATLQYSSDRSTLVKNLDTFKNNNRTTFRTLFGNDFTIEQFAGFLLAIQDALPGVINSSGVNLAELVGKSPTDIKNQLVAWTKTATSLVADPSTSKYHVFADKLSVLGLNMGALVDAQGRLGAVIDTSNAAEKALALAAIRSQVLCTIPKTLTMNKDELLEFEISVKGVDEGDIALVSLLDWYSSNTSAAIITTETGRYALKAVATGTTTTTTTITAIKKGGTPGVSSELVHITVTLTVN